MTLRSTVLFSFVGLFAAATAFSQTAIGSYLNELEGPSTAMKPASYSPFGSSYTPNFSNVVPESSTNIDQDMEISFAPGNFFGLHNLVSKGPRGSDWGTPADATCKLCDDGSFRAGAWYCSEGGWPSPNGKKHTEVFYVLEGYGSLEDADGVRHYFGPGDNVIIPKGHTGRWDVNQPIRKVWAVNDHERVEESSNPIRVQVDHYNSWAPQFMTKNLDNQQDPLYGHLSGSTTTSSSKTFYDVGPTQVGVWSSEPGSYVVSHGKRAWIHLLEGVMYVSNGANGSAYRCVAGDTIVLPAGWWGTVDVMETTKQLWTIAK